MKKQKKCYIYTRVSTAIQVDGYSLDAQKDKLRKYAEYQDMTIGSEFSDEGFSGKNIKGRPEFTRMMEKIESGEDGVDFVLVFKLSRFGRNAADVLNSLQSMQDYGVNLICVEDGIDSSKDAGKLMISVLSAVAEIERENIRTQTMAGREQKAKIGTAVDTSEMEERIEALRTQLKQVQGTKTRLEHQMDNLDVTDAHYNKKISDLQRRYDEQYDKAEIVETQMDEWNSRLLSVRQEKISADNVYRLLLAFDKLYNTFTEVEQRDFMRAFIERIDIYPEKPDNGCWIRNIVFNFPMPVQGREIKSLPLESESTVESCVLLERVSNRKADSYVKLNVKMEDYYRIKDAEKKTDE